MNLRWSLLLSPSILLIFTASTSIGACNSSGASDAKPTASAAESLDADTAKLVNAARESLKIMKSDGVVVAGPDGKPVPSKDAEKAVGSIPGGVALLRDLVRLEDETSTITHKVLTKKVMFRVGDESPIATESQDALLARFSKLKLADRRAFAKVAIGSSMYDMFKLTTDQYERLGGK